MEAKLIVVGGEIKSGEFTLNLPTVVGRGHDAGLRLAHPLVSRRHCEITEKDGLLHVRDLGSLNGTFIADNRISEAILRPDELITVGPVILRAIYAGVTAGDSLGPQAKAEAVALISGKKTARMTETVAPGVDGDVSPLGLSSDHSPDAANGAPAVDAARTTFTANGDAASTDVHLPADEQADDDEDDKLNDFFKGMGIK